MSWLLRQVIVAVLAGAGTTSTWSQESSPKAARYSPWAKICFGDICSTASGRGNDCRLIGSAVLHERKGETSKKLSVTLPKSVDVSRGVRIQIDDAEPLSHPFDQCHPAGCTASYESGPELVDRLSQGRMLVIEALDWTGSPLRVSLPLSGFAAAHDGPAGPEPRVTEHIVSAEEWRELQERAKRQKEEYERRCGPD